MAGWKSASAGILGEMWRKTAVGLMETGSKSMLDLMTGNFGTATAAIQESAGWVNDSFVSLCRDPYWHTRWAMDVQGKWLHALSIMSKGETDPRIKGLI